jgi:hypothetical protein
MAQRHLDRSAIAPARHQAIFQAGLLGEFAHQHDPGNHQDQDHDEAHQRCRPALGIVVIPCAMLPHSPSYTDSLPFVYQYLRLTDRALGVAAFYALFGRDVPAGENSRAFAWGGSALGFGDAAQRGGRRARPSFSLGP